MTTRSRDRIPSWLLLVLLPHYEYIGRRKAVCIVGLVRGEYEGLGWNLCSIPCGKWNLSVQRSWTDKAEREAVDRLEEGTNRASR